MKKSIYITVFTTIFICLLLIAFCIYIIVVEIGKVDKEIKEKNLEVITEVSQIKLYSNDILLDDNFSGGGYVILNKKEIIIHDMMEVDMIEIKFIVTNSGDLDAIYNFGLYSNEIESFSGLLCDVLIDDVNGAEKREYEEFKGYTDDIAIGFEENNIINIILTIKVLPDYEKVNTKFNYDGIFKFNYNS